jgi:hypothetical protein
MHLLEPNPVLSCKFQFSKHCIHVLHFSSPKGLGTQTGVSFLFSGEVATFNWLHNIVACAFFYYLGQCE